MNFYDHLNNGEKYYCDNCNISCLTEHEYIKYIFKNSRLCELCWNWVHLKKGECSKCGSGYTHRGYYNTIKKKCSCGNIVELVA